MMPTRGSTTSVDLRNVTLPVLALLDLSSADGRLTGGGSLLLRTAQTAVAEVNRRQLIPGHHLQLLVNDSKVNPSPLSSFVFISPFIKTETSFALRVAYCFFYEGPSHSLTRRRGLSTVGRRRKKRNSVDGIKRIDLSKGILKGCQQSEWLSGRGEMMLTGFSMGGIEWDYAMMYASPASILFSAKISGDGTGVVRGGRGGSRHHQRKLFAEGILLTQLLHRTIRQSLLTGGEVGKQPGRGRGRVCPSSQYDRLANGQEGQY